jgi:glycosyltransferase involved in cell wall biosynthesis
MTAAAEKPHLISSVVIATYNRTEHLRECLLSMAGQTLLPDEVILVDASDDQSTLELSQAMQSCSPFPVIYLAAAVKNPGAQRNQGAERAKGDLVFFLDDDVVLEQDFVAEIVRVFQEDAPGHVGGVSGTIVNQTYCPPSRLNRWLLRICVGRMEGSYAGRLLGPAVNFLPEDVPNRIQRVDWLNTTGTAYRKDIFLRYRFDERIQYPFDDLYLSARVAQDYVLLNTSRARFFHKDLGRRRERDWVGLGESLILGRYAVMKEVLGRTSLADYLRLFAYELLYSPLAGLRSGGEGNVVQVAQLLRGRLRGAFKIVAGKAKRG